MSDINTNALGQIAAQLFGVSRGIFWSALPAALLLALLTMFLSGQISGAKIESILRRLLIAIFLLVAFPQISAIFSSLDHSLVNAFGGEQSLTSIFSRVADQVRSVKDTSALSWLKVGQMGLSLITTISYMVLAFVQKFLVLLRLLIWNLLHVLGPIAMLGCLFPAFESVPRGIFLGLLEISLWRPLWVLLCRLLIAIGFGQPPGDLSQWLDLAILNFAVAALMVYTPSLVHGFLSGNLASTTSGALQSMIGGAGAMLAGAPAMAARSGLKMMNRRLLKPAFRAAVKRPAQRLVNRMRGKGDKSPPSRRPPPRKAPPPPRPSTPKPKESHGISETS